MDMGTLTDAEIRALKPAAKNYRKAAGRSLYLEVTKDGRKIWRVRFRSGEKEQPGAIPRALRLIKYVVYQRAVS